MAVGRLAGRAVDLGFGVGAGEGNRTLMTSLEGWGSAIELRPRVRRETRSPPAEHRQRTRKKAWRRMLCQATINR
jgi:hypothetical protein